MLALTRLTRTQELVVARASGVSVWQFLAPALALGFLIGVVAIVVLNPIAAAMIARYEQLEGRYISGRPSLLTVSASGLWLRQRESAAEIHGTQVKEYILSARRISQGDMVFSRVTAFTFGENDAFIARVDAGEARLGAGFWEFTDAVISLPGLPPERQERYHLPTRLEIGEIRDSFAEPRTLSFWQLSRFIHTLEEAGFDALRHKVHWHATLALPFMLCGMVLISAVFSLRLPRKGRIGWMILGALVAGFGLNFVVSLFHAFGYSGSLPVVLASWASPAIMILLGLVLLLHLEDG
jgi:lipopolysaccharide export system permease protein